MQTRQESPGRWKGVRRARQNMVLEPDCRQVGSPGVARYSGLRHF